MAKTTVTITITNVNKQPTVLGGGVDTIVISPTGITTPDTPYTEYVSDSLTITDGSIMFPLYNRVQTVKLPAASILTIQTDNYDEAAYYATLNVAGANISVDVDPLQLITVTFNKTTATVAAEATTSITATTNPAGQTVAWSTSDASVANVNNGTVTGVAAGTATITGTITVNGATASASCEITVTA